MARKAVRIGELRLRVPGIGVEAANRLGTDVAKGLAGTLPAESRYRELGMLRLRVAAPRGASAGQLATVIAEAIRKGLV